MEFVCVPLGSYQTNCYLVWQEEQDACVVIDPGDEVDTVLSAVMGLGKDVAAILLTHGHFDHVGAVRQLAAETDCDVYLHSAELSMPKVMTAGTLYCTHTYGEGDTVEIAGLQFRVLHTPGHTPGSVCLLCEDTLFSGDTLFAGSYGRTDLPGGDQNVMRSSLQRLARLEGELTVCPGHGPFTTLSYEKQTNPYLLRN